MGELQPLGTSERPALDSYGLDEAVVAFHENPGLSTAGDVLSHAVVLGLRDPDSESAARFIAEAQAGSGRLLEDLATRYLSDNISAETMLDSTPLFDLEDFRVRVAQMRGILRREPRNSIRWADLALAYVNLGHLAHAERAIRVALALSPNDRYVVRAAVRLYLLLDRPDKARSILSPSDIVRDPWLHASELTVSQILGKAPRSVRAARQAIEDERFAPWHLTELASELATIDLRAGKDKQAKRLLRSALIDPTENSQAQASWAIREHNLNLSSEPHNDLPLSNEAKARWLEQTRDYEGALEEARKWQVDQPFDPAPALFGSYIATMTLERYEDAVEIASRGLLANPGNAMLRNNLAYALANLGRVLEATIEIEKMGDAEDSSSAATLVATRGLVLFRSGDILGGRELYRAAVASFVKQNDVERTALATLLWAREELLARTPEARSIWESAVTAVAKVDRPIAAIVRERIVPLTRRRFG
jgi:Flp pilus assembly protein TadD